MKSSHFEGCQDHACLIQKPKQGTNGGRCRCSHAKIEAYINALKEERTLSKKRERYDFLPREMPDDRIGPGIPERMKQLSEKPLDLDREITRQYIATLQSQLAASHERERILREGLEEIGSLTAEVKAKDVEIATLKADISEQSGIIQRDWTSPYERQAMDKTIATLKTQLEAAEKGLKGIRDHKHKESWGVRHAYGNKNPECVSYDERESINSERGLSTEDGGRMQGHRCAAKLASETLVEMEKCECGK